MSAEIRKGKTWTLLYTFLLIQRWWLIQIKSRRVTNPGTAASIQQIRPSFQASKISDSDLRRNLQFRLRLRRKPYTAAVRVSPPLCCCYLNERGRIFCLPSEWRRRNLGFTIRWRSRRRSSRRRSLVRLACMYVASRPTISAILAMPAPPSTSTSSTGIPISICSWLHQPDFLFGSWIMRL